MAAAAQKKFITAAEAGEIADDIGLLRAQMKPLEDRYDALQKQLEEYLNGQPGSVDGEFYHINISRQERRTLDTKAVTEKLAEFMRSSALTRFINNHTKVSKFPVMRVSALIVGK